MGMGTGTAAEHQRDKGWAGFCGQAGSGGLLVCPVRACVCVDVRVHATCVREGVGEGAVQLPKAARLAAKQVQVQGAACRAASAAAWMCACMLTRWQPALLHIAGDRAVHDPDQASRPKALPAPPRRYPFVVPGQPCMLHQG